MIADEQGGVEIGSIVANDVEKDKRKSAIRMWPKIKICWFPYSRAFYS
jgi:hypothetical protein